MADDRRWEIRALCSSSVIFAESCSSLRRYERVRKLKWTLYGWAVISFSHIHLVTGTPHMIILNVFNSHKVHNWFLACVFWLWPSRWLIQKITFSKLKDVTGLSDEEVRTCLVALTANRQKVLLQHRDETTGSGTDSEAEETAYADGDTFSVNEGYFQSVKVVFLSSHFFNFFHVLMFLFLPIGRSYYHSYSYCPFGWCIWRGLWGKTEPRSHVWKEESNNWRCYSSTAEEGEVHGYRCHCIAGRFCYAVLVIAYKDCSVVCVIGDERLPRRPVWRTQTIWVVWVSLSRCLLGYWSTDKQWIFEKRWRELKRVTLCTR